MKPIYITEGVFLLQRQTTLLCNLMLSRILSVLSNSNVMPSNKVNDIRFQVLKVNT